MNERYSQDLTDCIKQKMKEELNTVYDKYIQQNLDKLQLEMESERNRIINSVLDGVRISVDNNSPYEGFNNYNINIRLENKIVMKG